MKRIVKLLARLYPTSWRDRYAAEFDALVEDRAPSAADAFDVLMGAIKMQMRWSFVRITLASCLFGLLAALAITFGLPPRYVSQTLIFVGSGLDAAGHPTGNMRQDAIVTALHNMKDDSLNSESLAPIIQKYDLYRRERAHMPMDAVVDLMRRDITIRQVQPQPSSTTSEGFVLQFNYPDPHVARQVDAELVSQLIAANLRFRVNSAAGGRPQPGMVFSVLNRASLPLEPSFPNRRVFGAGGLLVGLSGGLMLAAVVRFRQKRTPANGG
jgi:hypothetical protein